MMDRQTDKRTDRQNCYRASAQWETKIHILNSNLKQVLLYGLETWRKTNAMVNKIQVFINRSLKKILLIRWSDRMKNEDLWKATKHESAEILLKRRRWTWIGHILKNPATVSQEESSNGNHKDKGEEAFPRTHGEEE